MTLYLLSIKIFGRNQTQALMCVRQELCQLSDSPAQLFELSTYSVPCRPLPGLSLRITSMEGRKQREQGLRQSPHCDCIAMIRMGTVWERPQRDTDRGLAGGRGGGTVQLGPEAW